MRQAVGDPPLKPRLHGICTIPVVTICQRGSMEHAVAVDSLVELMQRGPTAGLPYRMQLDLTKQTYWLASARCEQLSAVTVVGTRGARAFL